MSRFSKRLIRSAGHWRMTKTTGWPTCNCLRTRRTISRRYSWHRGLRRYPASHAVESIAIARRLLPEAPAWWSASVDDDIGSEPRDIDPCFCRRSPRENGMVNLVFAVLGPRSWRHQSTAWTTSLYAPGPALSLVTGKGLTSAVDKCLPLAHHYFCC